MKRQTAILTDSVEVAKQSAEAALSQIKMTKEKERARLAVEIIPLEMVIFGTAATNHQSAEFWPNQCVQGYG